MIQYHGWADPQISPGNSVQYYRRVADALGGFVGPEAAGGDAPGVIDGGRNRREEAGRAPDERDGARGAERRGMRTELVELGGDEVELVGRRMSQGPPAC